MPWSVRFPVGVLWPVPRAAWEVLTSTQYGQLVVERLSYVYDQQGNLTCLTDCVGVDGMEYSSSVTNYENMWRRGECPWMPPCCLTKYRSATVHEEWQVSDPMYLRSQCLYLRVERLCGCIGSPVVEVVQHILFLAHDSVAHRDDFPDSRPSHVLSPLAQSLLGFLPVRYFAEDVAQGAQQAVCRLHLRLNLKQQVHFPSLEVSPVAGAFHQRVSHMREQVGLRLSVAQLGRLELLVLALGRSAYALAVLALPGRMLLPVLLPVLGIAFLFLLELAFLPLDLRGVGALELHAHCVKPLRAVELHDVEQVDDYLRLRELLPHDAHHAVREVHRHLLDLLAAPQGYLVQMPRHFGDRRAFDGGDERALLAMAVLVGKESEQVVVQHRLVDAQALAHVLPQQHPLTCMLLLVPVTIPAQVLLVGAAEVLTVSPEEAPHALGRHRVGVQPFFLRNPQTLQSSRSLLPPRAGFRG